MNTPPITPSSSEVVQFRPKAQKRHFLILGHDLLESPEYQSCTSDERALFIEIARLHNGHNNGRIHFSKREAMAALKIGDATAVRSFRRLEAAGLIVCTRRGSFNSKEASEWFVPSLGSNQNPAGFYPEPKKAFPGSTREPLIDTGRIDKIDPRTRTPEEARKFQESKDAANGSSASVALPSALKTPIPRSARPPSPAADCEWVRYDTPRWDLLERRAGISRLSRRADGQWVPQSVLRRAIGAGSGQ